MQEFYKEPRVLNIKKVVIISVILVVILLLLILFIAQKISKPKESSKSEPKSTSTSTVYKSSDESISIELPNTFNLKSYDSGLEYLLELRSENNLNIFISKENTLQNQTLDSIIQADKLAFLENFESYSNVSEPKELSINHYPAYTYSFHYLDKTLNTAFYLQVTWLQIDDILYTFDIEFPLDDLSFNTNISSAVLSSFKTEEKHSS